MESYLNNPMFMVFAFLILTSLAGTIGHYWHKMRRDELEAELKQAMIQRGMKADEIVMVLRGTKSKTSQERSNTEAEA